MKFSPICRGGWPVTILKTNLVGDYRPKILGIVHQPGYDHVVQWFETGRAYPDRIHSLDLLPATSTPLLPRTA